MTYDGIPLKASDYTVSYWIGAKDISKDAKYELVGSSADVTVKIKGKGNYADTEISFGSCYTIKKETAGTIDLSKAKITMQGDMKKQVPAQEYTGYAIKPAFDIFVQVGTNWQSAAMAGLTAGTDYEVYYINNVEKGNATIFVKAKAGSTKCVKSKAQNFRIGTWSFTNLMQLIKL